MDFFELLLFTNAAEGGGGMSGSLMFLGAFLMIMYFFMIRPQTKKAKEQQTFLSEIEKGTRIVTSGGIHGKIVKVDEGSSVLIEVDSGTKLRIEKSMISMDFTKAANADK